MGVVYEAEQESLGRRVALKVLPRLASQDPRSLMRFQREARASARLHHTNIVPVFEVGQQDDYFFYAMQLIQGQGLDLVIRDLARLRNGSSISRGLAVAPSEIAESLADGRFQIESLVDSSSVAEPFVDRGSNIDSSGLRNNLQLSAASAVARMPDSEKSALLAADSRERQFYRSIARVGEQAADALAYAHVRGVIHRDIKPSNLLLDAAGVVWVTDFGLAKTDDEGVTRTGDVLGTIRYMSPERFQGICDARADVYSLGLTVHEMLTLRPAFASSDRLQLIELVTNSDPPRPRTIDPRIPLDLETIVLKASDKDPNARYQSAEAMAEDFRRFIADEPIKARRVSLAERWLRWSRRNKALAGALTAIAMLLVSVSVVSPFAIYREARLRNQATVARQAAEVARKRSDRNLYFAEMNLAGQAANEPGGVLRVAQLTIQLA